MAILRAIKNEEYDNLEIANEFGITSQEINYDKQTLYKKDFIDRGFGYQRWVLTDLGEYALKYGFDSIVPTEDIKLAILNHLHLTIKPLCRLEFRLSNSINNRSKYDYHKRWLVKNGFICGETKRGKLTDKGIKALKDKSISKYMEA